MGWQSYYILYTSKGELEHITNTINEYQKIWFGYIKQGEQEEQGKHNSEGEEKQELEPIGEEIQCICFAKITVPKTCSEKFCLMFGIGGGRSYCENFFIKRNIILNYYESDDKIIKNINKKRHLWLKYDDYNGCKEFKYFTKEYIDRVGQIGFANLYSIEERENVIKFIIKSEDYKHYTKKALKLVPEDELIRVYNSLTVDKNV